MVGVSVHVVGVSGMGVSVVGVFVVGMFVWVCFKKLMAILVVAKVHAHTPYY